MLELQEYAESDTAPRSFEYFDNSKITISKRGTRVAIEIADITSMKWESSKLTLLVVGAVLMDFKDADARRAFDSLLGLGVPIDPSLGKVCW